ncbi:MAG: ribosomal RNA small subunit methyltransferase A [Clostridiales bacterium]|jgi:dimethyladenosine transferase|nr:ribosomal RNA small subunit methyltransferase A [Clostridiales bacterium]
MNIYEETKMIMKRYNLDFKKKFGQNFLTAEEILEEIISKAKISKDDIILEIGPGIGTLTSKLLETGAEVISVEVDLELIRPLKERFFMYNNFTIISADILKIDIYSEIVKILESKGKTLNDKKIKVVANIPYYITTPIMFKLLESRNIVSEIYIMVQKEVAERICAKIGTKESSSITYMVSYYTEYLWDIYVDKTKFVPSPKVDSKVIALKFREKPYPEVKNEELYFEIIRSAFLHRRKTFLNSISASNKIDKKIISNIMEELGIDLRIRAEKITDKMYADIVDKYIEKRR